MFFLRTFFPLMARVRRPSSKAGLMSLAIFIKFVQFFKKKFIKKNITSSSPVTHNTELTNFGCKKGKRTRNFAFLRHFGSRARPLAGLLAGLPSPTYKAKAD